MATQDRYSKFARFTLVSALTLLATYAQAAPPSYAAQVLADGPIGYWRLGEAPGSPTAADSSVNGNNGNYTGGITLGQPGFHGGDTAALFDGATGRIVVPNSATDNPARITMEAKVRWDGPTGLQQRILEKESFAGTTQYGLSVLPGGQVHVELRMRVSGAPQVVAADSIDLVASGAETHVAATYDGLKICIYLNGSPDNNGNPQNPGCKTVNSTPVDIDTKWPHTPPDDPEVALAIGDRMGIIPPDTRHRTFNGLIDEVALFDKALSADQVRAHYQSQLVEAKMFQYAVKFVCGKSSGGVVAPGDYFTAINVHNPNEKGIGFKKKFAIALPGERAGRVSRFFDAKLGPDEAFEIDCPDILRRTETKEGFLKGFVVIETAMELDVVGVYTAAGATGRVETMELERVSPRRQAAQGEPDLIPVPDPKLGFCRRKDLKLTVTVKNQGNAGAGPSTTMVDFGAAGTAAQPTPALAAGASVDLTFDIPASCFHGDCHFKITVDSSGQVVESDETNNTASGVCLG
jgi:Concanavalin A-like lectin/glucanases superfamily/CARDB